MEKPSPRGRSAPGGQERNNMIHRYQLNGYNIVLDVCSGSVHVVDEAAYDLIGLYEDHTREEAVAQIAAKYPQIEKSEL